MFSCSGWSCRLDREPRNELVGRPRFRQGLEHPGQGDCRSRIRQRHGLVSRLDSVLRTVKEKAGDQSEDNIAIEMLKEIRSEVIRLNSFAGLYIWSWLFVPIVCSFVALLW